MTDKYTKVNRVWLNPIKSNDDGMCSWEVEGRAGYVDAYFKIWDCSRKVELDFSFSSDPRPLWGASAKERATKLNILINELQKMKKALGEAHKYASEHEYEGIDVLSVEELSGEEE